MGDEKTKLKDILMRVLKVLSIAVAIAVVFGYYSFQMTMPSVVVPNTTNPSLIFPGLMFFLLGILVGLIADSLESLTISVLLGVVIGTILGWFIFISPTLSPDIIIPEVSGYFYNVLHSALPIIIVGLVLLFIGGFIGNSIMEGLITKTAPSLFGTTSEDRAKRSGGEKE